MQSHEIQTQYPHLQRLMMSGKDGVGHIIKAFVTVVTLIALTGRLRVIKAALDDLGGLTRWAGDTIWPAQLTDGLITLDIIDEIRDIDLHGGLLSEIVEGDGVSIHHPQIHDPGIQYERSGYVLRSAAVLGALGYSVEVLEPEQGLSLRGTSDDKLISGDVLRKLLVKLENHVDLNAPLRLPPYEPSLAVKVRQRVSRRAVKGDVDAAEAEARAQRVATTLVDWYNDTVGPSLLQYARVGTGRRIHIVDTTHVEVPLETGTYECSGVVKNDDGSRSRGYKLATLRTLLDHAGLITQVGLCPIQVHDLPLCRLFFETAPVLRQGDLVLEDRGFVDGETITFLKQQRHVDVIVPLKSTMLSSQEAVQLANLQATWQPHPSREHQHIAFVKGVEHLWEACQVPLNACVIRYWNRKKAALDHIVLVTTDHQLTGPWIVRHYEQRPEIEQDYEQMKSGGWQP